MTFKGKDCEETLEMKYDV